MNERIKELAEQCWEERKYGPAWFNQEKFAELIIEECLEQVKDQYLPVKEDEDMMKDPKWIGYVHCGVDVMVAIKQHFSVE